MRPRPGLRRPRPTFRAPRPLNAGRGSVFLGSGAFTPRGGPTLEGLAPGGLTLGGAHARARLKILGSGSGAGESGDRRIASVPSLECPSLDPRWARHAGENGVVRGGREGRAAHRPLTPGGASRGPSREGRYSIGRRNNTGIV